ncbi:uncharacterized protein TRUGW13939_10613 [Talaromyces rugulosus]|uniref:SRR1-like domain-containing protein n=1 Tax=Talaromyces rugulosus TaxID=121627 RepID=A0A7H8RFV8_TALRU|nr:uncharacterized protein TRUGW13939_10613 [Talaromyces rugulosus]QKX63443.1 hypothetical protein TRUGW13939_10613 [Talaromyces rugulosus]
MPHTSRRHRNHVSNNPLRAAHGKRLQITDDDGWVHVVNTSISDSSPRTKPKTYTSATTDGSADDPDCSPSSKQEEKEKEEEEEGKLPLILPAEAPPRLTLSSLRQKFDADLAAWQTSATWTTLRDSLLRILARLPAGSEFDRLVCIGLGSPSGLRDGWVDRRDVASYQLAAFVSLVQSVQQEQEQETSQTGEAAATTRKMEIIAQDPIFNALDKQLLSSLGITVVAHPQAFSSVTAQTLLFAPGAEKRHLELVLPARPLVLFGGPLEEDTGRLYQNQQKQKDSVIEQFLTTTQSMKLVEFGPRPEAFWRMRIYWRDLVD